MEYFIFSFLRSGKKAKRGVEFRYTPSNALSGGKWGKEFAIAYTYNMRK